MDGTPEKKKWELTKEAFDKFLACLDPDPEQAGREYERLRERLNWLFERRGCPSPNELTDETMDRVMRKVLGGELLENPEAYCLGVARNVLREYWDSHARLEGGLDDVPTRNQPVFDPITEGREHDATEYKEQRLECQRKCFRLLDAADRELIIPYARKNKSEREELARRKGMELGALRLKVFRIRQKLLKCTGRCLEQAQTG